MPEALVFVAPDGAVTDLKALPGVRVLGDQGFDMPPFTFVEDDLPGGDGARLRSVRTMARDVTLPFFLEDADETALRGLLRVLVRRMNPRAGDGRLRHTASDGSVRELTCRYVEGLGGNRVRGQGGATWRRGALVFRAHDPFWHDQAATSLQFTAGTAQPFYADQPFFGLRLASDVVLGTQTVTNDGDVEAWPVWTVKGPSTSPLTLENVTTGQRLDLPVSLSAAQSVVIDTRPLRKTVRRDDGANLFGSLVGSLWSLPTGPSKVAIALPGATSESYVTLDYVRRWLMP